MPDVFNEALERHYAVVSELERNRKASAEVNQRVHELTKRLELRAESGVVFSEEQRAELSENISSSAARLMELKYRQFKEHVQHLKAEIRDNKDSSAYLRAMELIAVIPQLKHVANHYLTTQDADAIDADVRSILDQVSWLQDMAVATSDGIQIFDDGTKHVVRDTPFTWDREKDIADGGTGESPAELRERVVKPLLAEVEPGDFAEWDRKLDQELANLDSHGSDDRDQ